MYSIIFRPLEPIYSGVIDHQKALIIINSNKNYTRQQITIAHELIHMYAYLCKQDFTEEQVHGLAVFIVSEIFPRLCEFSTGDR